ncbi:hypothetical protein CDEST_15500 [Colletotrichum destructivum]|uniref:Uncharacterized protein n=1 Tax=Colletotrichum destructivum TaxID=34406 RepID=A0AAX4J519_9PEZI|nr:hypothetical protein CDEST_15500 [Colletotrichum destructivum]
MDGRLYRSSYFEDVRLPSICSTRKTEPGFTPLPRLVELTPSPYLTPTVSDVSRRPHHQPARPRPTYRRQPWQAESIRQHTDEGSRLPRARRVLPPNAVVYLDTTMQYQIEILPIWLHNYHARTQKSRTSRAGWNLSTHRLLLGRHRTCVTLHTARCA